MSRWERAGSGRACRILRRQRRTQMPTMVAMAITVLPGTVRGIPFASPDAKLVRTIDLPVPFVTNLNFGPDGTVIVLSTACFAPWKAR